MIPLCVPNLKGNELKYVQECIDTEWVSSAGKYVNQFEEKTAEFTGSKYAVAVSNGTSALHIGLLLSGVRAGDEVIVPALTFIAPINVVHYLFAEPVFMDCDEYYNIDVNKTIEFLKNETTFRDGTTFNNMTGKRITALMPVHVFGNAVDIEPLINICNERNIKVVEDATESLGTFYNSGNLKGRHTGTIADFGALSYNGNKVITTGGGGMILTNNEEYAKKAKYLTTQAKDDEVRYVHGDVGFNYRLTNIQAALGVAQMEQLKGFLEIKKHNYEYYKEKINNIDGLQIANTPNYSKNNYWMIAMQIDKKVYGKDREELMAYLGENKIQTRPVWHLNHLQKPFAHNQSYKVEKAFELAENTLNIPCSTNLTKEDMDLVISTLSGK